MIPTRPSRLLRAAARPLFGLVRTVAGGVVARGLAALWPTRVGTGRARLRRPRPGGSRPLSSIPRGCPLRLMQMASGRCTAGAVGAVRRRRAARCRPA